MESMPRGIARRKLLKYGVALGVATSVGSYAEPTYAEVMTGDDRKFWIEVVTRVSEPVLRALSERRLKATMPIEAPHGDPEQRKQFRYLEALGRLLSGLAPWLESEMDSGAEGNLRRQ